MILVDIMILMVEPGKPKKKQKITHFLLQCSTGRKDKSTLRYSEVR